MAKSGRQESKSTGSQTWIARDARSGRFVEIKSAKGSQAAVVLERLAAKSKVVSDRRPGRFKGVLSIGPEFFEPLSEKELKELNGA
ncbi:hypothetical protein [Rhizobium sp. LjRoot254]|uniref:hypothetical protein n=1 Tax=Rhizobium sp. LjRoot254 TaxID=3342297 RepID=UPI003ECF358B